MVNLWNYSIDAINKELEDDWAVKMIVPYNQHVACGGRGVYKEGVYGAFIVLEKSETVRETLDTVTNNNIDFIKQQLSLD